MLRKLLFLGLAGYAASKLFPRPEHHPSRATRHAGRAVPNRIRQAGPREMVDPPRDWDLTDERGDESFPASDPPGNY